MRIEGSGRVGIGSYVNLDMTGLGADTPLLMWLSHGTAALPITDEHPTISFQRFDATTLVSGTTGGFYFGQTNSGGTTGARSTVAIEMVDYLTFSPTPPERHDSQVLALFSRSSGTTYGTGLYIDAAIGIISGWPGAQGGIEIVVRNFTGVDAPLMTAALGYGFLTGINLFAEHNTGDHGSTAILIGAATAADSWRQGIWFAPNSVNDYGIDFSDLTGITPIRIANNTVIVSRNHDGNSDLSLIKAEPAGATEDWITVAGWFTFTTAQILKIQGVALRGTTEGTNHLDIFDGTAPVGILTNGFSLYSASGNPHFMDSGGHDLGFDITTSSTLTISGSTTLNQDVSTTSSPTFVNPTFGTQTAGALTGTLLTSVASGNPTVWFKIKSGASYYAVPGWLIPA